MTLLSPKSFARGVHPDEHKDTAGLPIRRMPFVERYVLPLVQHIGAPMLCVVKVGQSVKRAEIVAEPGGFVSTTLHSPVQGTVSAIGKRRHPNGQWVEAIEVEADPYCSQLTPPRRHHWQSLDRHEFVEAVRAAGLVGMGGAAFPSHVKYAPGDGKRIRWIVLNGCECEPYLTGDHRLMVERPGDVIAGARILLDRLAAEGVKIGVEMNKPDAIEALRGAATESDAIEIVPLRVKYPQGAEKMLIRAIFGDEVPAGKLPIDLQIVVNNVATAVALADYFDRGIPLIERVVTVAGSGVKEPANLVVPIGTSVSDVLRYVGVYGETRQIVMGGPMMGMPLASTDVPVLKGTSGILAFTDVEVEQSAEYQCIRCGRCVEACGNNLNPSRLAKLARNRRYDELESYFAADCMECGACTFACPSGIPIVQMIRSAKAVIREKKAKLE